MLHYVFWNAMIVNDKVKVVSLCGVYCYVNKLQQNCGKNYSPSVTCKYYDLWVIS